MLKLDDIKNVYFLGIGGIGMSAIARWFHQNGYHVGGYDKTPTTLTNQLIEEGMDIHFDDKVGRIPTLFYQKENTLIIRTPAVPTDNPEYKYFNLSGYQLYKRSQVLGLLTQNMFTIGVAGTHGKTTTSSMVAHVLKNAGLNINAFLGGIATNFNSNLLIGEKNGIVVIEADEYDRSFLTLFPDIAIVTSTDADHLDIYGEDAEVKKSFSAYVSQIKSNGTLFYKNGIELDFDASKLDTVNSYGINGEIQIINTKIGVSNFHFDIYQNDLPLIENIELNVPGFHNVENATATCLVALKLGIDKDKIKEGIASFKGVKRRFEYHIREGKTIYVDDYAHHPTEVEAFLSSIKAMYPSKKITTVFQPHLFSRTKDFADGFAKSLSISDSLILLEVYPAREKPMEGVTSNLIFDQVSISDKQLCAKADLLDLLTTIETDVLVTMGAGDIDRFIEPIKELLNSQK